MDQEKKKELRIKKMIKDLAKHSWCIHRAPHICEYPPTTERNIDDRDFEVGNMWINSNTDSLYVFEGISDGNGKWREINPEELSGNAK